MEASCVECVCKFVALLTFPRPVFRAKGRILSNARLVCTSSKLFLPCNLSRYLHRHQDGKRVGVYDGDRSYDDLTRYINDHVRDYVENSRRDSHSIAEAPNQSGEVQILDSSTFSGLISEGPVFVKFFAPW